MSQEGLERIKRFEKYLRPTNLLETARAYALTSSRLGPILETDCDDIENVSSHLERLGQVVREIGAEIVQDTHAFETILPELFTSDNSRLSVFGAGLAIGCKDRLKVWQTLYAQLKKTPPESRYFGVLTGFLSSCAVQDPGIYNTILDSLIDDELLGEWFPIFQVTSTINAQGIERLNKSLDRDKVNINNFRWLAYGQAHEAIDDDSLASLIQKISAKEGGLFVALEILSARFHELSAGSKEYSSKLVKVGQEVIRNFPYHAEQTRNRSFDFELGQIANVCLSGKDSAEVARQICQTIAVGYKHYRILAFDYPNLLSRLARFHPNTFLDTFVENEPDIYGSRMRFDDFDREENPFNAIPDQVLLNWCQNDPEKRYPRLVQLLHTYQKKQELSWKPIVYSILEKAPNISDVLLGLQSAIYPSSWGGSYADTLEQRLVLFTSLNEHPNHMVRDWAEKQYLKLKSIINVERENELRSNQESFERFE